MIINLNLIAQSGEVSLNYQYGMAGSRFRADYNSHDNFSNGKQGDLTASNWLNDQNILINYKHPFIKRWNLTWNFGFEIGKFNRFNNIAWNGIIYDVVKYKVNRTEYQIGLNKRFNLKSSEVSFDLGFDLSYRQYKFSESSLSATEYQSSYPYGTVEYYYQFYNEDKGFGYSKKPQILNLELQFNSHFPLIKNLFLDAGVRVAFNYFEYQYSNYLIRQYDADGNLMNYYYLQSVGAPKMRIGDYIYLNIGMSYQFDWKKISLFNKKKTN